MVVTAGTWYGSDFVIGVCTATLSSTSQATVPDAAYPQARTETGSVLSLSWSVDGTQLAGCGSSGSVCFANLIDIRLEDGRVHVVLVDERHIQVHDILSETKEQLDFRDPVVKMSLGWCQTSQRLAFLYCMLGNVCNLKDCLPHVVITFQQHPCHECSL